MSVPALIASSGSDGYSMPRTPIPLDQDIDAKHIDVMPCLLTSHTYARGRMRFFEPNGRYYSIKLREAQWRVIGHHQRVLLSDVAFRVNERLRQQVIRERCKTPHASARGTACATLEIADDASHARLLEAMLWDGQFVSYNPLCGPHFVQLVSTGPRLTAESSNLEPISRASLVYLYEDGMLAVSDDASKDRVLREVQL